MAQFVFHAAKIAFLYIFVRYINLSSMLPKSFSLSLKALLPVLLFCCCASVQAQQHFWHSDPESSDGTRKAGDLYLDLPASFYFFNNEFFGPAVEGYTLPG